MTGYHHYFDREWTGSVLAWIVVIFKGCTDVWYMYKFIDTCTAQLETAKGLNYVEEFENGTAASSLAGEIRAE